MKIDENSRKQQKTNENIKSYQVFVLIISRYITGDNGLLVAVSASSPRSAPISWIERRPKNI